MTDPAAYEAIGHWDDWDAAALQAKFSLSSADVSALQCEIQALIDRKQLFSPALALPEKRRDGTVKALCLHVAHSCNMACDYCFAQAGRYRGPEALMPFEVGKQALLFLLAHSGKRRHLEVDFFGGEPLLNWQVVKDLVGFARSREREAGKLFRFTLTTNGLLLDDEVTAFCNREMDNVVLSLDGRPAVHDRLRRTLHGQGSYALVVPKFQEFVRRRGSRSYYIRGTFTHANPAFTKDLYHMADLGFRALSMEPVVCPADSPHALTRADLDVVLREYEALALEMHRRQGGPREFTFYHYNLDLKRGPCLYKRAAGCGSGTEYFAVTPAGKLYPCHQFVGEEAFCMGDVWRGIARENLRDDFAACTIANQAECRSCWAKYYCAGGCAANAFHAAGSMHGVYRTGCELFQKRMECAIYLAAMKGKQ